MGVIEFFRVGGPYPRRSISGAVFVTLQDAHGYGLEGEFAESAWVPVPREKYCGGETSFILLRLRSGWLDSGCLC